MKAHIATCVAIGNKGVLIEGPTGSGKSSLALELIDRGATFIGDDGVMLEAKSGQLFAYPHPNTRGMLEIRNLGVVTLPTAGRVKVALVITLDTNAPRFIEYATTLNRSGVSIPSIAVWPDSAATALKIEYALKIYGSTD